VKALGKKVEANSRDIKTLTAVVRGPALKVGDIIEEELASDPIVLPIVRVVLGDLGLHTRLSRVEREVRIASVNYLPSILDVPPWLFRDFTL